MPAPITLTLAHSADADDAFMWWPLGDAGASPPIAPAIDTQEFRFIPIAGDIEEFNRRAAERADLDITAISMRTYADVHHRYALTNCGSSMGDGYGPKVVARHAMRFEELLNPNTTLAIPGERTTAYLALRLLLTSSAPHAAPRTPQVAPMPFDHIIPAVRAGKIDAGLVIHEGQVTFADAGLHLVADLGALWKQRTGLPLPLGGNAIKRDLDDRFGPGTLRRVAGILEQSIRHALDHRATGIEHARRMHGGMSGSMPIELVDRYIGMYVNPLTVDAGEPGRAAIERLLRDGAAAGFCPDPGPIRLISAMSQ